MSATQMTAANSQRWGWFLDIVFGAIVAISIEKYEPVLRDAWNQGFTAFAISLSVAIAVCSFVVYDIAAYHVFTGKYPYGNTRLGFARFYLDLIMAFTLYVLLVNAFQKEPDWVSIAATISFWHLGALVWHGLAQMEVGTVKEDIHAVLPHILYIITYWIVVLVAYALGSTLALDEKSQSTLTLISLSIAILCISLVRLSAVVRRYA